MDSVRTVQTAFRFNPEMVRRMKNRARLQGKSLNAYIENLVEKDLEGEMDRYEALFQELSQMEVPGSISPEIEDCFSRFKVEITTEMLEEDERLAYLLSR